jgi:ADP-heptose:LPS heptosyltransferase
MLAEAGINKVPKPNIDWMRSDISHLNLPKKYFIFVPGCSPTQPHKRWKAENYGEIANQLIQKGIIPIVIGTKDESMIIQTIQKICPKVISLEGKTSLFDIAELGRHAVGALGHDTGPMHIVAVTNCPSLMLFSWSSIPKHYAPRGFCTTVLHENNLNAITVKEVIKSLTII